MPGSGAYSVAIDQDAGGGGKKGAVVPLPPTNNTGVVHFNPVFLSLANSSTSPVTADVTIFRTGTASKFAVTVAAQTRVSVLNASPTAPGDLAVAIATQTAVAAGDFLTALVEYGTP